jgi:hypothetical protein
MRKKRENEGQLAKENPIKRVAEEVESHLLEGAELATSTTSAETNVALAALGAIEGPPDEESNTETKPAKSKRRKSRSETR